MLSNGQLSKQPLGRPLLGGQPLDGQPSSGQFDQNLETNYRTHHLGFNPPNL